MIAGIKDAFKTNLPQVKWMDEETKTKALNKVQLSFFLYEVHEGCTNYAFSIRATCYRMDFILAT